jgi:plasmid replication initiation protein
VEARDAGLRPSRLMQATPYEILRFIGRGTSLRDYQRLKAALDRLQSTTVATSIRETTGRRLHRFSWINEWKELADAKGTPLGLELILPDWFYAGVMDAALVLTIDPAYFRLTGGIERWLYRLVRKHGGRQPGGWQFDFRHLYRKSGSATRFSDFAYDLRALVARQSMPGYVLGIERMPDNGAELLTFGPCRSRHGDKPCIACGRTRAIRSTGYRAIGSTTLVLSGVRIARKPNNGVGFRPSNF